MHPLHWSVKIHNGQKSNYEIFNWNQDLHCLKHCKFSLILSELFGAYV